MQNWMRSGFIKTFLVVVIVCGLYNAVQAREMDQKQYVQTIRQLSESGAMDNWRGKMPMQSQADILTYLKQFDTWSQLAADAQNYQWVETEYIFVTQFKEKIRAVQVEAFPNLRFALGKALTQELQGIAVNAGGGGYRNIRLTNKDFQDMDLVREVHADMGTLLLELRFTKVEFMLDHEDITANFRLMDIADNAIILWDAEHKSYGVVN